MSIFERIKSLLFRNTDTRQTVAKNTFWLTFSNFGGRLLRAVVIILAARLLGTEGYGIFSYAMSLVAFVTIFIDMGLSSVMNREVSRGKEGIERTRIISTTFYIKTILLGIGVCAVLFVAPHLATIPEAIPLFPLIACILIFDVSRDFTYWLVRAMERMEIEAITYVGMNLFIMITGFIFLMIHPSAYSFTLAYVVGTGLGTLWAIFTMRKALRGIFTEFSWPLAYPLIRMAAPFAVSGVMGAFFLNTDILLIGAMRSAGDVGLYAAAQRIMQLLYIIPSILAVSLFPVMARFAHNDDKRLVRMIENIFHQLYLVALPIAIGGVIFGFQIITLIFGKEYAGAVPAFQVLLITIIADFPATIRSNVLFAYDNQKKLVVYALIGGVLNVILDLILIPRFGIVGSSWATLVSQVVSNAYLWYAMRQVSHISVFGNLQRVAFASVLMGIFAWLLNNIWGVHVVLAVLISGMAYLGILMLLGEPLIKEFKLTISPNGSS